MTLLKHISWTLIVAAALLITACGGSGGDGDSSGGAVTAETVGSAGIAVDPYIVNAQFEELSPEMEVRQRSSTASDSQGRFSFARPIAEDSLVRLKGSSKGLHGSAPYQGMLKRTFSDDDDGPFVISPLTTLIANGMSPAEVIQMMAGAGLPGLQEDDLLRDPMANLVDRSTGINDQMLTSLQANMAANAYMEATGNFDFNGRDALSATGLNMAAMVNMVKSTLSAAQHEKLVTAIASDFTLGDLSQASVAAVRTVISQIRQEMSSGGQNLSAAWIQQQTDAALANIDETSQAIYAGRTGNGSTEPAPAPGPEPIPATTGEALYASECQGCHGDLTHSDIGNRSSSGIQAAINGNAGGMNRLSLSTTEIQSIAAVLSNQIPLPVEPPQSRTGQATYDQECSSCHALGSHDPVGAIDLAGMGSNIIAKLEAGHKSKNLPTAELNALADFADTFASPPPPTVERNGETTYSANCAACHKLNGYDEIGNIDLAGKGSAAVTKVAGGHGGAVSTQELTTLADWLNSWAPTPPPVIDRNGETVYNNNCAACHKLNGYDEVGNIDLASMGNAAMTKTNTGHGGSMTAGEQAKLADWIDSWAPVPPPVVDRNGEAVYNDNCAGCHKINGYDPIGNIDLAGAGNAAFAKTGSGHGGTMSSGEQNNLANWLDTWTPAPPPVVTRTGQTVYDDDCAGCHKVNSYDANGSAPDIAAAGSKATSKLNAGHSGINLSVEEVANLAAWLNTFEATDPYAGSCNACHGQPPAGNTFPDTVGAHAVHQALPDAAGTCAVCHDGAAHNDWVDLGFTATWDAKSGTATDNMDGTCSKVSCHGGLSTPNWQTGSINVDTQCKSCHVYGTGEYNGYASGRHSKHVNSEGYSCTVCHDTGKLRNGHFGNLATRTFEQAPANTIKSSLSYSGGRCSSPGCHSGKSW